MNGSIWFQTCLFLLAYVCAFSMLLGYKTRLSTFLCFFLLLSVQNRNPLVLQGGDDLLRLLLFWAIFLPLGKIWSIDGYGNKKPEQLRYFSLGNVGYVMLLFSVYFFTAMMKHSAEWYSEGTALYYAFSIDQMAYPLSKLIYPYPELLKFLTFGTIYLELIAPLLLLIPFRTNIFRGLFIVSLTALHVGIGLTMQVGYFHIISIVAMIGLWPDRFITPFEKLAHRVGQLRLWDSLRAFTNPPINKTSYTLSSVAKKVAITAIFISLIWNIGNVATIPSPIRNVVKPIGLVSGLSQNWGMFAPTVFKGDGWFVYEAITESGDTIDLLNPESLIDYSKPEWAVYQYKNAKWRKLGENLIRSKNKNIRQPFCRYQLTKHNQAHPEQKVWKLNVTYFREKTLPNYEVDEVEKGKICSCSLIKKEEKAEEIAETR